ncbi:MAG: hypothetical protein AAF763_12665 [Pseudomonadota bacterium]
MKSLLFVLALGVVAAVAVWSYRVNYDTLAALDRVEALQRRIAAEQEAIAVLRAEWAWLNRPERLARLAAAKLPDLAPMAPAQFAEASSVAFQPPPPQGPDGRPEPLPPILAASLESLFGTGAAPSVAEPESRPGGVFAALSPPEGVRPAPPPAPQALDVAGLVGRDHISQGFPLPSRRPAESLR